MGHSSVLHLLQQEKVGTLHSQRVHVGIWDILGPYSRYMGTPLGPKYIPYAYMDPLGFILWRSAISDLPRAACVLQGTASPQGSMHWSF